MKQKRIDTKDIVIGALVALVALEAYLLFFHKPKKPPLPLKPSRPAVSKEIIPKPAIVKEPSFTKSATAQVAIIIDDCGYSMQPCQFASLIKVPITFSILPHLDYSDDVAECVHKSNKEVMLHLPLEPHEILEKYPKDYLIKTTMDKNKIETILNGNLDGIPYVAGVNNHTGSKATEDRRTMKIIFANLKKRGLFFVDSLVTNQSICRTLAFEMHLPFSERDVFLDNENEKEYIEGQFDQLVAQARQKGFAIGIGHARSLTLQVIKEKVEGLKNEGVEFVAVKTLLSR